eukprot:COSAG06_NODE_1961_length_7974_cov_43.011808_2_plen_236_part_00
MDRNHDGEVDFQEFYAWYEQEMTEAKMRDRPLYAEVKEMFNGARNKKRTETSILTMTLSHQFYEPTMTCSKSTMTCRSLWRQARDKHESNTLKNERYGSCVFIASFYDRADMDADGSGELDIGEVKQLAETLLAPVDSASGAPRGLTPTVRTETYFCVPFYTKTMIICQDRLGTSMGKVETETRFLQELGDIMTKMDRDGNNAVDFEEFYYWCVLLCCVWFLDGLVTMAQALSWS